MSPIITSLFLTKKVNSDTWFRFSPLCILLSTLSVWTDNANTAVGACVVFPDNQPEFPQLAYC